jgi:hypothetical protein
MHRVLIAAVITLACLSNIGATVMPHDPAIGTYEGVYQSTGRPDGEASATVIAEGPGLYRLTARHSVGEESAQIELHGQSAGPRVLFHGFSNSVFWSGELSDGALRVTRGDAAYGGMYDLKQVMHESPTAGLAPPEEAVVLLPYAEGVEPSLDAWTNAGWKAQPDGSVEVTPGTGPNFTKQAFADVRLHLEFQLPNMALAFGQLRANSGVYFMNRYEVQVLDSFGVHQSAGDCGAVYLVSTPRVNASLPPGAWQTYDIEFRAPRLGPDGTVREHARLTVRHNGVLIQENVEVPGATVGGDTGPAVERDVLQLQDHGDPVRYRNIWLVELD